VSTIPTLPPADNPFIRRPVSTALRLAGVALLLVPLLGLAVHVALFLWDSRPAVTAYVDAATQLAHLRQVKAESAENPAADESNLREAEAAVAAHTPVAVAYYQSRAPLAVFVGAWIVFALTFKHQKRTRMRLNQVTRIACFVWVASIMLIVPGIFVGLRGVIS
jgi:hypothetical protein